MLDKDDAYKIARKLSAVIDTTKRAHDLACIYYEGVLVAQYGIRRGSRRNQGHGHIPHSLHLTQKEASLLALCPLSKDEFFQLLKDRGIITVENDAQDSD